MSAARCRPRPTVPPSGWMVEWFKPVSDDDRNAIELGKLSRLCSLSGRSAYQMKLLIKTETLVLSAMLCLAGCKGKPQTTPPPPPTVEVVTVKQADVPLYHEWIGVLDGLVNAHIRAQVAGYLMTQNYREGDPIKKG